MKAILLSLGLLACAGSDRDSFAQTTEIQNGAIFTQFSGEQLEAVTHAWTALQERYGFEDGLGEFTVTYTKAPDYPPTIAFSLPGLRRNPDGTVTNRPTRLYQVVVDGDRIEIAESEF